MTLEDSFVSLASGALEILESLNAIEVFGLGAATWIYIMIIVSLLLSLLFIFLPGISFGGSDDNKGVRK